MRTTTFIVSTKIKGRIGTQFVTSILQSNHLNSGLVWNIQKMGDRSDSSIT